MASNVSLDRTQLFLPDTLLLYFTFSVLMIIIHVDRVVILCESNDQIIVTVIV